MTTGAAGPRIFISAGEVSGDIVASRLIEALRAIDPSIVVDGVGGPRMAAAGATVIASANHIGAVGVSEGLAVAPAALRVFGAVKRHVRAQRPQVAVLIANDVFNVVLGRSLRAMGITTISLFPPQTWIWQSLARVIAPSFDLVLAAFPEEAQCYGEAGVATEFVGHYLADVLAPGTPETRVAARAALGLSMSDPVVALLPGSRALEIERLLPIMLSTADLIRADLSAVQVVAVLSETRALSHHDALHTPLGHIVPLSADSHLTMHAADVVVSCSGTATLEASLIGTPMVVTYLTSRVTYAIIRACMRVGLMAGDTVALPNLILGRHVVPEFIQRHVTATAIAAAALRLIPDGEPQRTQREALRAVRAHVARPDTLTAAARMIMDRVTR
jgi:lipid-A-disaccharide synthase